MTKIQKCLATNMKHFRKLKGFTQEDLAIKADTSTNYIGIIEIGKQFPSLKTLSKIAAALEIDELDLFTDSNLLKNEKFIILPESVNPLELIEGITEKDKEILLYIIGKFKLDKK